jgi:hypothetical protein
MDNQTPDFAILQKDKNKSSAIWIKEKGNWTDLPQEDFQVIKDLAQLIRVTPNPMEVVDELKIQATGKNKNNN